ncbi:MAG: single-stranded-DNA-specific exonuclease RecJ, partial [Eubacterium sp.]|nr:single-stranded-DNA-specific exonuclease RecJ [Eubacterium sp.]
SSMESLWMLAQDKPDGELSFTGIGKRLGISAVVARCICNRGIKTAEGIRDFMYGSTDDLHDPFLMKGVREACELIRSLYEKKDGDVRIAIASDYDCDGIFSAQVLKVGLMGLAEHDDRMNSDLEQSESTGRWNKKPEIFIFTPDRVSEGYGLNRRIVDDAVEKKCELLITCDNGIAAIDGVRYARECGLQVIVTDHHEPQDELPDADIIIDPKQQDDEYPFDGLCGAGVAFKLICALDRYITGCYGGSDPDPDDPREQAPSGTACTGLTEAETELLQYVAIATVADVMELKDENRILVKYGLEVLEKTKNPGLKALLTAQGIADRKLRGSDIGFIIGPCFNSSGRLSSVKEAFDVLMAEDEKSSADAAAKLKTLNDERKKITEDGLDAGMKMLLKMYPDAGAGDLPDVILIYIEEVHESVVGLIAGKIKERFNHPVIFFTDAENTDGSDDELIKGSGRSIVQYNMFEKLLACKDLMVRFGGHAMAAGLTIKKNDLAELDSRLNSDTGLRREDFVPVLRIDLEVPVTYLNEALIDEIETMAPFGNGNPRPMFAARGLGIASVRHMGAEGQHIRLSLVYRDERTSPAREKTAEGVAFGEAERFDRFMKENNDPERIDIIYQPQINEYRGMRSIQLLIRDFRVSHIGQDR